MDRSMTIGASMRLDLENSYYIYIMSALYFAVPAVTGQLVLGAKAGAASLATGAIGNLAGESGRAAGQGSGGDLSQRARANQAAVGQAAYAKDMRGQAAAGGFAAKALGEGNAKMMTDAGAAFNQTAMSGEGQASKFAYHNMQSDQNAMTSAAAGTRAGLQILQNTASFAARQLGPGNNYRGPQPQPQGPAQAAPSATGAPAATGAPTNSSGGSGGGSGSSVGSGNPLVDFLKQKGVPNIGIGSDAGGTAAGNAMANLDLGTTKALGESTERNIRQQAMSDALQGQAGVNSFGYGQRARGLEVSSGRNSAAADFSAKSAQYDAERNMATSLGGELAAMGAGGALSIGSKPVGMEPMAMVGQLGKGMKGQAEFAGSGFQAFVASGQQTLQGMYGYDSMMARYRPGDGKAMMDRAMSHTVPTGGLLAGTRAANSAFGGERLNQQALDQRPGGQVKGTPQLSDPGKLVNANLKNLPQP
jgi:hypothetical protein